MTDGRRNRPKYSEPGSMDRIFEAAVIYGNVDTDEGHDGEFARARARLRQAVLCHTRAALGRLLNMASKGGKARAAKLTPERRKEIAERAAAVRWTRAMLAGKQEPEQSNEEGENQSG